MPKGGKNKDSRSAVTNMALANEPTQAVSSGAVRGKDEASDARKTTMTPEKHFETHKWILKTHPTTISDITHLQPQQRSFCKEFQEQHGRLFQSLKAEVRRRTEDLEDKVSHLKTSLEEQAVLVKESQSRQEILHDISDDCHQRLEDLQRQIFRLDGSLAKQQMLIQSEEEARKNWQLEVRQAVQITVEGLMSKVSEALQNQQALDQQLKRYTIHNFDVARREFHDLDERFDRFEQEAGQKNEEDRRKIRGLESKTDQLERAIIEHKWQSQKSQDDWGRRHEQLILHVQALEGHLESRQHDTNQALRKIYGMGAWIAIGIAVFLWTCVILKLFVL